MVAVGDGGDVGGGVAVSQRREPYTKLYASWWCHPRTGPLSLAAGGLEARMLSWSAHHGADGRVPKASLAQLAGGASKKEIGRAIAELLSAGVVAEDGDAYVIRDYLDANISKERDEERRRGQNERQSRHRQSTVTRDITPPVTRDRSVTNTPSLDHDHDHDQETRSTSVSDARAPEPVDARPKSVESARQAIEAAYRKRGLAVPGPIAALTPDYETHSRLAGLDAERLPPMLEAFFGDDSMASKGFPVSWFLANPNQWAKPTTSTPTGGLPADLDDFERLALTRAEEGTPWAAGGKLEAAWHRVAVRHPSVIATRRHPGYATSARPAA